MKPLWVAVIVCVVVICLCSGNLVFAADSGPGRDPSSRSHQGGEGHSWGHDGGGHHSGGHFDSRFDVVIGDPFWGPGWYYPYYPYYPNYSYYPYSYYEYDPYYSPELADPSTSQEYIERSQERRPQNSPAPAAGVWYYCPKSRAYYPYVKKCPDGWQKVPVEPPSEEER